MIQRIQTLYMLAVCVLVSVVMLLPMARFTMSDTDMALMSYGLRIGGEAVTVTWWAGCSAALLAISALLPLVTVFLYKKRLVQIRLLGAECALLVGALLFESYYVFSSYNNLASSAVYGSSKTHTLLLLVPALVLCVMAMRAVGRDEALVRSLDRIR